jgi:hypothetical protein
MDLLFWMPAVFMAIVAGLLVLAVIGEWFLSWFD